MAKFLILQNSSEPASVQMANATREQMEASMAEWMAWREAIKGKVDIQFGMPLEIVGSVTADGLKPGSSDVRGYATIEAETKEAALGALQSHPHMKRPDASIDVYEMLSMPGLEG